MGLPELQPESELILSGQLHDEDDLDLATLLSALELGRQHLTLELLDDEGELVGSVSVKAGRVLSASADGLTGAEAVRELLDSPEVKSFRVQLESNDAAHDREPLGTIAELSEPSQFADQTEEYEIAGRTRILEGELDARLPLDEILRVVGFSRQHVNVELRDEAGRLLGEISAKSGKVLAVRAGDKVDQAALQALLRAPVGTKFALFIDEENVSHLRPLGSFAELLRRSPPVVSNGVRKTLPPPLPGGATRRDAEPSGVTPRARILEGSLDEFELAHVLSVLGTSRQHFELHVRDDASETVGVILVKSGIVVGASVGELTGIEAARELLRARTGRFVAIRRAQPPADKPPLVSVSELLAPAPVPPSSAHEDHEDYEEEEAEAASPQSNALPVPVPVLDGKLGDLDVASILHVAGASRQYTCVHIFDDMRRPLGVIDVKAGQVVRAKAQDVTGVVAVRRLLHSPRDFSFLVQRYPSGPELTASIGSIANVLERAAKLAVPPHLLVHAPRPEALTVPPPAAPLNGSQQRGWLSGAVVGGGFVLLGGILSVLFLRSPSEPSTSVSAATVPPPAAPPPAAPPPAVKEPEPVADAPGNNGNTSNNATQSRAAVASYQAGLRQLGYETGPVDGVLGPRTTAAIRAFQYAEHLAVDGTLSAATRAVLLRRIEEPSSAPPPPHRKPAQAE